MRTGNSSNCCDRNCILINITKSKKELLNFIDFKAFYNRSKHFVIKFNLAKDNETVP
jgi:hypothetical protein